MLLFSFISAGKLNKAAYECRSTDKSIVYKGLNSYKSLYIEALINNDKQLKIASLHGLIECSKKLGLDYKSYQKELEHYITKKASHSQHRTKHIKLAPNRLKQILIKPDFILLKFTYPLYDKEIKKFSLVDKRKKIYKDIFDIHGKFRGFKRYRLGTDKILKIAQYKKDTIRVVVQSSKPHFSSSTIEGTKLYIYFQKKTYIPQVVQNAKKVIVVDPGHGGKDSGAVGYKRKKEKDIVLAIAKRVYKRLKAAGYKVYLTRRGDYFVTLRNRTKFANRVKANLFISIHANAAPTKRKYLSMKGLETFYLSPARSERSKRIAALENRVELKNMSYYSKDVFLNFINREKTIQSNKLAIDIQRAILANLRKRFNVVDGGVRPGPFWVLVGAQMPSILIEVGYITNPTEAKRLSSPYYQNLIAQGIVEGVQNYFKHNEVY